MSLAWSSVKALSIPVGGTARDVKRVSVGGVEVWRKRPFDAEVEYIESTGTQWIDTSVLMQTNTRVQMSALLGNNTNDMPFGIVYRPGASGTTVYRFGIQNISDDNHRMVVFAGTGTSTIVPYPYGQVLEISLDGGNGTAVVNSTSTQVSGAVSFSAASPIFVFARNQFVQGVSSANAPASMRLYWTKMYDGPVLVRDFVPVRVGQTGYLYDRANPTGGPLGNGLYPNSGTGAFVVGPDKSS